MKFNLISSFRLVRDDACLADNPLEQAVKPQEGHLHFYF